MPLVYVFVNAIWILIVLFFNRYLSHLVTLVNMSSTAGTNTVVNVDGDLTAFPAISFSDIEAYVLLKSGCKGTERGYQYFAERGYLHDIKLSYQGGSAEVTAKCYRSQKKNDPPHQITLTVASFLDSIDISGHCSCTAGIAGYCNHAVGLLYFMAHCKKMKFTSVPDEITCTSMRERWSVPRGKKISNEEIQYVKVKKVQPGADYSRCIKSNLYSPASNYPVLTESDYHNLEPTPLAATIAPKDNHSFSTIPSKFGDMIKGSVISYQQKFSNKYIIHDYSYASFPELPLTHAGDRFENNLCICLQHDKMVALESLNLSLQMAAAVEGDTRSQSLSTQWQMLRNKRITASKFGIAAKRQRDFENFVKQIMQRCKVNCNMQRGLDFEDQAAFIYATVAMACEVNLFPSGLVINPKCPWLGCTPDRKVFCWSDKYGGQSPIGLLEIKVVKAGATDFENVDYLVKDASNNMHLKKNHNYYYQVQCQLALTGLEWCDFFSFIDDSTFFCERITFDPGFFQMAKDKVDLFYFNYFLGH